MPTNPVHQPTSLHRKQLKIGARTPELPRPLDGQTDQRACCSNSSLKETMRLVIKKETLLRLPWTTSSEKVSFKAHMQQMQSASSYNPTRRTTKTKTKPATESSQPSFQPKEDIKDQQLTTAISPVTLRQRNI